MPQQQKTITLKMLDGSCREAVATGNNAAWFCVCERKLPLIGHSFADEKSENGVVVCPACGERYFVLAEGRTFSSVQEVKQLASKKFSNSQLITNH